MPTRTFSVEPLHWHLAVVMVQCDRSSGAVIGTKDYAYNLTGDYQCLSSHDCFTVPTFSGVYIGF